MVTLHLSRDTIAEADGTSRVTASLDRPSSADTVVTVSPAAAGSYRLSVDRELTIPAGDTRSRDRVTVFGEDNEVDAPDKQVEVSAAAANTHGIVDPDPVALTIADDDEAPAVMLDLAPASIPEDGGVSRVTARLSHPSSADTVVTITAGAGAAGGGGATTCWARTGELTIPAGETESAGRGDDRRRGQ